MLVSSSSMENRHKWTRSQYSTQIQLRSPTRVVNVPVNNTSPKKKKLEKTAIKERAMVTVEGYIRMCGKMCSKARQVLKTKDDPENEREREREGKRVGVENCRPVE